MALREAINNLDTRAVTGVWEDALSLFSLDNCLNHLALPVQRSLAERPGTDQVAAAELSYFSRWLRQTLDARLRQCQPDGEAPCVVAAALQEHPTNIDLLRFALSAAQTGLAVRLLGSGAPLAGLGPLASRANARALVLFSDVGVQQTARLIHWPEGDKAPALPVYALGAGFDPLPPSLEAVGVTSLGLDPDRAAARLHGRLSRNQP
jgi:hypothetical protein